MSRIKHATAGAFVFAQVNDEWMLGLIDHPRLGRKMIPGGHVEDNEQCAQAAVREVEEETGLRVTLMPAPVALPLPAGYPHQPVAAPWWITELDAVADNHTREPHIHIDHQYVALTTNTVPARVPAHPFEWYAEGQIGDIAMFEDTRLLAKALFGCVDRLTTDGHIDAVLAALSNA